VEKVEESTSFIEGKEVTTKPLFDEPTIAARSLKKQAMRAMEVQIYTISAPIVFSNHAFRAWITLFMIAYCIVNN